jgi:YD repeat-containing protein
MLADGTLTIFGYDKLRRQDRIFSGAIVELKSNEYKFEGLPVGEEFDIFATKNNNEPVAGGIDKIELDNLTFVKHTTVKTTGSTLIGKLSTPSKQIIIVRKQPIQRVEFDFAGRTIASYDTQNNQTFYFHDSLGRQIAVVQPVAGEDNTRLARESFYDLAGNVIANVVAPFDAVTLKPIENKKRVTRMEPDAIGRVTKIIQPHPTLKNKDGAITRNEHDLNGNIIKMIDPLGNETNYCYDNLNRKIFEINAEGGETKYTYDSVGRMKTLTDPVGNTMSWSYNFLGLVSREEIVQNGVRQNRYFFMKAPEILFVSLIATDELPNGLMTDSTAKNTKSGMTQLIYGYKKNRQNNSRQHTTIAEN